MSSSFSVPSIAYLTASALQNNSILVEWEMEYDGGHLITVFEVHVLLHSPRNEATMPSHADLVYHVNPWTGRLVTRPVTAGYTYTARATATNLLGPSEDKLHNGISHNKTTTEIRNSRSYKNILNSSASYHGAIITIATIQQKTFT